MIKKRTHLRRLSLKQESLTFSKNFCEYQTFDNQTCAYTIDAALFISYSVIRTLRLIYPDDIRV